MTCDVSRVGILQTCFKNLRCAIRANKRSVCSGQEDRFLNRCFLEVVARFEFHGLPRPFAILDAPALVASRVAALLRGGRRD